MTTINGTAAQAALPRVIRFVPSHVFRVLRQSLTTNYHDTLIGQPKREKKKKNPSKVPGVVSIRFDHFFCFFFL